MYQARVSTEYKDLKLNGRFHATNIAVFGYAEFAKKIFAESQTKDNIVGFIPYDCKENTLSEPIPYSVLGSVADFESLVQQHNITRIWLAVDPTDFEKLAKLVEVCKKLNIEFEVPTKSGIINSGMHVEDAFYNDIELYQKFLSLLIGDRTLQQPLWLRAFDLVVSLSLLILFLPSWILVALAIKLESSGGVLYSQERVGLGGKVFRIYKFRSMYADAEKRRGPQLATHNDPRITKVGRFMRKTRIDELPQLFNVIKGDMSLIGPRPERPFFVEKYRIQIPGYVERLRVKPGLTGWAQVVTGYDESLEDVKAKLQCDLYFIDHYNDLKMYVQIIIKTIWVVLSAQGQ